MPKLTANQVLNRIEIAKKQGKDNYDDWNESLRMLLNQWDMNVKSNEPRLAPNVVFSTYRRLLASLNYSNPKIYTVAMERAALDYENAVSGTLSYYDHSLGISDQMRLITADGILYPYGVYQLGMSRAYQTEKEVRDEQDSDEKAQDENINIMEEIPIFVQERDNHEVHIERHNELKTSDTILTLAPDIQAQIVGIIDDHIAEHGQYVQVEGDSYSQWEPDSSQKPFVRRRRPHDFFWEPGASLLDEAGYVMLRSWPRVADVRNNPRLKNTENLQATDIDPHIADLFDERDMMVDDDLARVALWDIFDIRKRTWETWSDGSQEPHFVFEDAQTGSNWPYREMEGYPFGVVSFNTVPDKLAGPPVTEYLKHPQELAMQLYENIATHSVRANAKYLAHMQNIEGNQDAVINALQNPEQQAVIFVKDVNNAIRAVEQNTLDPAIFSSLGLTDKTVQENSGLVDAARGQVTGASATETSQAASATNILIGDDINILVRAYEGMYSKLLGMLKQYGPDIFSFRDLRYKEQWIDYTRKNLLHDYQIRVEISPPGDEQRLQVAWINLHHELANSPNVQGDGIREIQREMVRSYGIEPDRVIRGPGVSTEAMVEYEHVLMQQGQPLEPRQGEDYSYHMEKHSEVISQIQGQMQQLATQVVSQAAQANPLIAQDPNAQQQVMAQNPQIQQLNQFLTLLTAHLESTQQIAPSGGTGRPRNAASIPDGNPGRVDSIASAQGRAG